MEPNYEELENISEEELQEMQEQLFKANPMLKAITYAFNTVGTSKEEENKFKDIINEGDYGVINPEVELDDIMAVKDDIITTTKSDSKLNESKDGTTDQILNILAGSVATAGVILEKSNKVAELYPLLYKTRDGLFNLVNDMMDKVKEYKENLKCVEEILEKADSEDLTEDEKITKVYNLVESYIAEHELEMTKENVFKTFFLLAYRNKHAVEIPFDFVSSDAINPLLKDIIEEYAKEKFSIIDYLKILRVYYTSMIFNILFSLTKGLEPDNFGHSHHDHKCNCGGNCHNHKHEEE